MNKNTLFHHKKFEKRSLRSSKQLSEPQQPFTQNPESQAKHCLLQISEQTLKINGQAQIYFQPQHARSFSTEFFNHKQKIANNPFLIQGEKNSFNLRRFSKKESQQSVTIKSTFSNEMRRTHNPNSSSAFTDFSPCPNSERSSLIVSRSDSIRKLRKINCLPFTVEEQNEIENLDEIFKTTPSKQIIAILKRSKLSKQSKEKDQNQKEKDQLTIRKKSIFNIRHLMLKQKSEIQSCKKDSEIQEKRHQSPDFMKPKQIHSTNCSVVKMRLKNRYNKSELGR